MRQKVEVCRVRVNIKFPCKAFVLVNFLNEHRESYRKQQTKAVQFKQLTADFNQSFLLSDTPTQQQLTAGDRPRNSDITPRELQFVLYTETKNGIKLVGKVSHSPRSLIDMDAAYSQSKQITLSLQKCPDKEATLVIKYHGITPEWLQTIRQQSQSLSHLQLTQQSRLKGLINEKSRLQSMVSLLELQNYQKDIIIKNLNLELKLKVQENMYLFSAQKIKEVSGNLQQEIKQLKQKISEQENQNRHLRKQLALETSRNKSITVSAFSKVVTRLERELQNILRESSQVRIDSPSIKVLSVQDHLQTPPDNQQQLSNSSETPSYLVSQIERFEKLLKSLQVKNLESVKQLKHQENEIQQKTFRIQELELQIRKMTQIILHLNKEKEDLIRKIQQAHQKQLQLVNQLHISSEVLKHKDSQIRGLQTQVINIRNRCASHQVDIRNLHQLKQKLTVSQSQLKKQLQDQQAWYQKSLETLRIDLQERKAIELKNTTTSLQKEQELRITINTLQQKLRALTIENQLILEQKQNLTQQLQNIEDELSVLQFKLSQQQHVFSLSTTKSKTNLKEISNTNINIMETYNRLKQESEYRLNEEKREKAILQQQLQDLRNRYVTETARLEDRVIQLEHLQKQAILLCRKLGFSEQDHQIIDSVPTRLTNKQQSLNEFAAESRRSNPKSPSRYSHSSASMWQSQGSISSPAAGIQKY